MPAFLSCGRVRYAVWSCLMVLSACAKPLPLPQVAAPEIVERIDVVPPLPVSTFAVALGLDLRLLEPLLTDLLNTELPLRQADWTRVTEEGANPQVETRMQARVEKLKLGVKGNAVRIKARIAYWGEARAQLATPFGKAWLSRGTDWGTKKQPGSVLLTLTLEPKLSRAFGLSTHTTLERVSFEAPAGDALCGKIVIKVCVPREQAAKQVHAALKRAIEGASPQLLAEVDRRVARQSDVAGAVARALRTLEHATPSLDETWLKLTVSEVALGDVGGTEVRATLPLELSLRPQFGAQQPDVERTLPARSYPQGLLTQWVFDAPLPFQQVSQAMSQALTGIALQSFRVRKLEVLGVSKASGRLAFSLNMVRDQEELTVYAEADPVLQGDRLLLSAVQLTDSSRRALEPLELDQAALVAAVSQRGSLVLSEFGRRYLQALRGKLQAPLVLFGNLDLSFEGPPTFDTLRFARAGLVVRVHGRARSELH